jgi:HSP90 family molecular chaperone
LSLTGDADSSTGMPEIKLRANAEENTVTIEDSGVGMAKDEYVMHGSCQQTD